MTIKIVAANGQTKAAGGLIIAADTGNVLTVLRSYKVEDGRTWCGVGGKLEEGETPVVAARREIEEEIGYNGSMQLLPAFVYDTSELLFYNFIGVVPTQFVASLNWESDGYGWTPLKDIPKPIHYGLAALLKDTKSAATIQRVLKSISTTASHGHRSHLRRSARA